MWSLKTEIYIYIDRMIQINQFGNNLSLICQMTGPINLKDTVSEV